MGLAFGLEAAAILLLLVFLHDAPAFIVLSGLVFFRWGEIFSLVPSTLTEADARHLFGRTDARALRRIGAGGVSLTLTPLHQPALRLGGGDEARKQRMGLKRAGFELRMELHTDKPGVIGEFHGFGQKAVGRHAGEDEALRFQAGAVGGIDLVAVAVAFGDFGLAVNTGDPRAGL
jgi:hypothetical protein